LRLITSNFTRTYETLVRGVPFEELQEKHGVGPKLHLFLRAEFVKFDLFGRNIWEQSYKRWSRAVPNRPLFDNIILLSDGQVVYQGPREDVIEFFQSMGSDALRGRV